MDAPRIASFGAEVYFFLDQILGGTDEVVEHILLVRLHSGFVPLAAVLAAATQVGHRIDAAQFEPGGDGGRKCRLQRDIETAVAVENRRIAAVVREPFARGDEHRHARAVAAGVENLLRLVLRRIERDLGRAPHAAMEQGQVVAIHGGRRRVTGKSIESLRVVRAPAEAGGRADAGQGDLAERLALFVEQAHFAVRVLHVGGNDLVIDDARALQRVLALRDDLLPLRLVRFVEIDRDDAVARRIEVGQEIQDLFPVAEKFVTGIPVADQGLDRREYVLLRLLLRMLAANLRSGWLGHGCTRRFPLLFFVAFGQIAIQHEILLLGAAIHADDQPAAVVADLAAEAPIRLLLVLVKQFVLVLIVAKPVKV